MAQISKPNCTSCEVLLDPLNSVYTRTGRLNICKPCYNANKRRVNHEPKHIARIKEWHKNYHLENRYGISQEDLQRRLDLQLGGCAICKQPFEKFAVDHDHKTNATRDLLCYRCNTILGLVNDDEDLLIDCIEYLKRHLKSA
jgi:Recombination endonuclease VII